MIFKILRPGDWPAFQRDGRCEGSADDKRDGFIHFSTAEQLRGTLEKHYAGDRQVILVAVDETGLGSELRWEVSRGGALFPHLYEPLGMAHTRGWKAFDPTTIAGLS